VSARVYLSAPDLAGDELAMLSDAIASGWIAPLGPHVEAFEREMCERIGTPHALALSSGTAALHLALLVLDVQPDEHVWTSTLTFAATANAIRYVGAIPVFVDSERKSWNMDPELLVAALHQAGRERRLPKAVIAVDLYGQCADYEPIVEACKRHGVWLIEDAAEALGATYGGRAAGSFGDLAIFSFNGNKIITTSGGGMLVGRRKEWIDRARYLATQARQPVVHYEHTEVGYNYRLSNLLAAIGRAQLADLDRRVEKRRTINSRYRERLGDMAGLSFMPEAPSGRSTCWLTCATAPSLETRDVLLQALDAENIEARPLWKPMHLQPAFAAYRAIGGRVAQALFETGICLPSGSALEMGTIDRVIDVIRASYRS